MNNHKGLTDNRQQQKDVPKQKDTLGPMVHNRLTTLAGATIGDDAGLQWTGSFKDNRAQTNAKKKMTMTHETL